MRFLDAKGNSAVYLGTLLFGDPLSNVEHQIRFFRRSGTGFRLQRAECFPQNFEEWTVFE